MCVSLGEPLSYDWYWIYNAEAKTCGIVEDDCNNDYPVLETSGFWTEEDCLRFCSRPDSGKESDFVTKIKVIFTFF